MESGIQGLADQNYEDNYGSGTVCDVISVLHSVGSLIAYTKCTLVRSYFNSMT